MCLIQMWCKQLMALKALVQHLEARVDELKEQGNTDVSTETAKQSYIGAGYSYRAAGNTAHIRGVVGKVAILNKQNTREREDYTVKCT